MCDLNQDPASNDLDPRILADGWTAVGIICGRDDVLATAPSARQGIPPQNAGLRQSMVRPGADIRRYGYLAVNAAGDTYAAVIRGTDGAEEWIDNVVFIAERRAISLPAPIRLEQRASVRSCTPLRNSAITISWTHLIPK